MIVQFMDGPKAGEIFEIPDSSNRVTVDVIRDEYSMIFGAGIVPRSVDYVIHTYLGQFFNNLNVGVFAVAKLAYLGEPPKIPKSIKVFQAVIRHNECPDFIEDFDGWWRWQLFDQQVTQDRETRRDLQRLEYAVEEANRWLLR